MPATEPGTVRFQGRDYAAALFDMDGTMLDSSAVVNRVWRAWGARHGLDVEAMMATIHGVRAEDTIRRFAPAGADLAAENAAILQAELDDVDGIVPIAGIAAYVASLPQGAWAIVTSAPRPLAERRLRAAGLPVPDTLVTAEDVARGKPDPQGFLLAAERLGVPIGDCLVFEDSAAGLAAAQASGAHVVAVGGHGAAPEGAIAIGDYSDR